MSNGEKGITAIKLIFTIIILALIISGIIFIIKKVWQDNSVKNIGTDLLYIKAKCKIIHDKNIIDTNEQLLGENIKEYAESEEVNKIISESDKWYKLRQEDLEAIGVGELKAEDGYLVNYETEDIIYAKGILEDEEIYYKLSDLEVAQEQKEKEAIDKEKQESEGVEQKSADEEQKTEEQPPKENEKQTEPQIKELIAGAHAPDETTVITEQPQSEVQVNGEQQP